MYKIEVKSYGIKLTFEGFISPEEMQAYKDEFKTTLDLVPQQFGLLADMRSMKPLPAESQAILSAYPEWTATRIVRSATIIDSALVKMQSRRLSKEWKQDSTKRYIDSTQFHDWENRAEGWINEGIEPE
ncbi:MAG: hypothetical protein R8G66_25810 [Cytophagales bacterium]|nr:hypothetical protein [Cytophagales bacterium]